VHDFLVAEGECRQTKRGLRLQTELLNGLTNGPTD
jgi:hypothetical protein